MKLLFIYFYLLFIGQVISETIDCIKDDRGLCEDTSDQIIGCDEDEDADLCLNFGSTKAPESMVRQEKPKTTRKPKFIYKFLKSRRKGSKKVKGLQALKVDDPDVITTTGKLSLVSKVKNLMNKVKIYYGDNDRPVTKQLKSIKSIKERVIVHQNRRKKSFKYRIRFGQLLRDDITSMAQTVKAALKVFQKYFRLNVTGQVDLSTIGIMNKPRCAGKDMGEQRVSPTHMTLKDKLMNFIGSAVKTAFGRTKRHTLAGSRWLVKNITYKITKYPSKFRNNRSIIDEEFAKAFKFWSDVTPLVFTRLPANTPSREVLIDIRFERGEHGDGDPLDGVGKVLAHSYFPQYGGDAHFDDDEMWTFGVNEGSNLLMAATHELGHSLGLDHSDVTDSIMNPIYPPYKIDRKLSQDDVRGIHILYGAKEGVEVVPNLCRNSYIDAIYQEINSHTVYVFQNNYHWKVKSDEMIVDSDYPKKVREKFKGFRGNVSAIVQMSDKNIFVFQNEIVFKYNETNDLFEGFPKKIKDVFKSLPKTFDAAYRMDGLIYAFKDDKYWTYVIDDDLRDDEMREEPQLIADKWPGVPGGVSAVLSIKNAIYFFENQSYYRLNKFNDEYKLTVSIPNYPRNTALNWFGCSSTSVQDSGV